jgi:hypothetical protein
MHNQKQSINIKNLHSAAKPNFWKNSYWVDRISVLWQHREIRRRERCLFSPVPKDKRKLVNGNNSGLLFEASNTFTKVC